MPFNMAVTGIGGRFFELSITVEDLSLSYTVETEVVSKFGTSTKAGDKIQLNIASVDLVAISQFVYTIDGDSLHDDALLTIILTTGCRIFGKGGGGGKGGNSEWVGVDASSVGSNGGTGGTAIRFGCPTRIKGTGTIEHGYGGGGGGGGGATSNANSHGGGGGGAGAALGLGGSGGTDLEGLGGDGVNGSPGTLTGKGLGGAAGGANGGAGGAGAENGTGSSNGSAGVKAGGSGGADGDAIDSQGFTHSEDGGVTVIGGII